MSRRRSIEIKILFAISLFWENNVYSKPDAEIIQIKSPACLSQNYSINNYLDTTKNLTGLWHLEYTGSDLAKNFVKQLPANERKKIRVAIWDTSLHYQRPFGQTSICKETYRTAFIPSFSDGQYMHGHMVSSFISGQFGPMDLNGQIDSIVHSQWSGKSDLVELSNSVQRGLRIINYSIAKTDIFNPTYGDPKKNTSLALIDALDKNNVIVISGTGNWGAERLEMGYDKQAESSILVGAIDPQGWRADFSNSSTKRTILFAPGKHVASETPTGQIVSAEGTSFAAPQVTGVVGLALELLPALNRQIVEEILWYTGLNGPKGSQDATPPKIINSYKFIRVIERLASDIKKLPAKTEAIVRSHIREKIKKQ